MKAFWGSLYHKLILLKTTRSRVWGSLGQVGVPFCDFNSRGVHTHTHTHTHTHQRHTHTHPLQTNKSDIYNTHTNIINDRTTYQRHTYTHTHTHTHTHTPHYHSTHTHTHTSLSFTQPHTHTHTHTRGWVPNPVRTRTKLNKGKSTV